MADFSLGRIGVIIQRAPGHAHKFARDWWRGWSEKDVVYLALKIDNPTFYNGGIIKISVSEYRAWPELNRRLAAKHPKLIRSPVLAWAEGKGLFPMVRLSVSPE